MKRLALVGAVALCAAALATAERRAIPKDTADEGSPTYTNVQVVSLDVAGRTLVIRNAKGLEEKVELDDKLAGFGDIKAGDRVMLTLRAGPGWTRVSSIVKSKAVPAPRGTVTIAPNPSVAPVDPVLASRDAFASQVARLSRQGDGVDRLWNEFRSSCDSMTVKPQEGARGWFSIWEGTARADLSGGFCRDLFNQIIDLGEPIKAEMVAAEEVAQRTLPPGDIRDIRRQYRMEWDGWTLTAPKQLDQ